MSDSQTKSNIVYTVWKLKGASIIHLRQCKHLTAPFHNLFKHPPTAKWDSLQQSWHCLKCKDGWILYALMCKNKLLDVLTFSTISQRISSRFFCFSSSKASTVCLSMAKPQRIHNLIKLRAWVSLEAHGSTAINLYTSADCWDSRKPQPPHATCIMNRCARSWSHWSSDAWRMAEFHQRPRVKSYPLPDPGIRHRCMMSVPMCWDWKVTANPLTHLRLPYGAGIPATTHREPWTFSSQIPTSNYSVPEELRTFFYSPSPAIPLYQPAPRHPPKPFTCGRKHIVQEEVQTMSQLVGHGFSMIWPCNSWCRAVSFYYLLNTTQTHHFVNALLKKRHSCSSTKSIFRNINFCPLYK